MGQLRILAAMGAWCAIAMCTLLLLPGMCSAFLCTSQLALSSHGPAQLPQWHTSSSHLQMKAEPSMPFPKDLKETAASLRSAVQASLKAQLSFIDVEIPPGARLGVELEKSALVDKDRPDRELARLFVGMFSGTPVEETMVVAFPSDELAAKAKSIWGPGSFKGKVVALKAKKKKGGKPLRGTVPAGTEVLVVVAPTSKELAAVQTLSQELGKGCLMILLNARLDKAKFEDSEQREFFMKAFQPVFHLQPLPKEEGKEDFLYRAYPKDWTVARARKLGPPQVVATFDDRPTPEEIATARDQPVAATGGFLAGLFGR